MNRKELINKISSERGISKKVVKLFLNIMEHIILEEIVSNPKGMVKIKGFGTFKKVQRKGRNIRLPQGDVIEIGDKCTVKFIPCKDLKNICNSDSNKSLQDEALTLESKKRTRTATHNTKTRETGSITSITQPIKSVNQGAEAFTDNSQTMTNITKKGELITGKRQPTELEKNVFKPEYIGYTSCGEQFHQISKWEYYPNMYIPAKNTEILSAIESANYQVRGVSEGKFREIIEQATSCIPEIEIQDNMHIPIIGTTQCYDPDFVLSWAKENIYVDIEIDEKYDIESGTPIHFISSRDEDRDVYLVEQGWCVLRISEEDVINYPQELIQTIKNYLYFISYDARFKPIQQQTHKVNRWTYDEAKEAADKHFREKLLGLQEKPYDKTIENDTKIQEKEVSIFIPKKYKDLEMQIIAAKKSKFVVVAVYPNGGEYAFENSSIKIIKDKCCKLSGYDVIEEKEILIPFYKIYKIDGRDDIIGERIGESADIVQQHKDMTKAINIARLSCNPVKFNYTNRQGEETPRTVVYLSYWFKIMNDKSFTMEETLLRSSSWLYENEIDTPVSKGNADYFSGFCLKSKEHKTFRTDRINDLIVYNIYKPHPEVVYGDDDICDCLEKGKLDVVEYIFKTIPPFISETCLNIGNKCNYLIMKGELDKAYKEITSIEPNFVVKNIMEWKDIVLSGCEHFIKSDNHADNFREMVSRLKSFWNT